VCDAITAHGAKHIMQVSAQLELILMLLSDNKDQVDANRWVAE
jgi:hypothetical protein